MGNDEQDPEARGYVAILRRGLAELGWIDGDNLRLEVRWGNADPDRIRVYAKELVGLRPDLIVSHTTPVTAALHRETRSLPIVFLIVSDPVGAGFVESLAHPGGNITGLISFEADIAGKWLEILTEVSPSVNRAAILFNPETAAGNGTYYLKPFEKAARDLAVQAIVSPVRSEPEIVAAISAVSQHPSGGIVVMTDVFMFVHRATVIRLAEKLRLPAVYYQAVFAREGGLVSYGSDNRDIFRRAAPYLDRVLRGAHPSEMPVQTPIQLQMTVNLRTARAIGIAIPPSVLLQADEVIE